MELEKLLQNKKDKLSDELSKLNNKSGSISISELQDLKQTIKDDYYKTLSIIADYQSNNKEIPSVYEDYELLVVNLEAKINYEIDRQIRGE